MYRLKLHSFKDKFDNAALYNASFFRIRMYDKLSGSQLIQIRLIKITINREPKIYHIFSS